MVSVYYGDVEYLVRIRSRANSSVYFDLMGEHTLLRPAMSVQSTGAVLLAPFIDRGLLLALQQAEIIGEWHRGSNTIVAEFGPELLQALDK